MKYTDSGVEWIDEIPVNWSIKSLKHFSEITLGKMLTNENKGGYFYKPYLRSYNIQSEKVDLSDVKEMWFSFDELKSLKLVKGDLLVNEGGDVGRTATWNEELSECYFQNSVNRVQVHNGFSHFFLYHFLLHHFTGYFDSVVNRVSIPHLTKEKLSIVSFCFPPLPEQIQIAAFLDRKTSIIDDLIQKKLRKIELLKEQRQSIITRAVTKGLIPEVTMKDSGVKWIGGMPEHWELTRINVLGHFTKGSGIKKDEITVSGKPCIRYGEIYTQYERIVYSPISFISEETSQQCVRIFKGDILFTGSGETIEDIGKSVVYYGEDDIFVGGDIIILRLRPDLDPLFISYMMNSSYVIHQKSIIGKGEIIVHIYHKDLKDVVICLPPFSEQNEIVEYLDKKTSEIDKQVDLENRKIDLLKEYRQSLISEVVTGKIDVRTN